MNGERLMELAKEYGAWAKAIRHDLHQIPEKSGEEFKTQAYLADRLTALNIPNEPMLTGVVGMIVGAGPGKTIALRADIDALPVLEPECNAVRSCREGWMHACGHDAHMAILLGAAKLLNDHRDEWSGKVKLIFQPAEECTEGAAGMVRQGVMEGVDAVYGLHVMPHAAAGMIEMKAGTINASADALDIEVLGTGCHGAYPERGADAIVCAAQMITALQTLVSRNAPPTQAAVFSIGALEGGTVRNIVCDRVVLNGTLRTVNPALRETMIRRIYEVVNGVAAAMGCSARVTMNEPCPAVINHPEEARKVMALGEMLLGRENVIEREAPSMGAEDFSEYLAAAPGAFYHIGSANPDEPIPAPALHSRDFKVDDRCLCVGIAMQAGLIIQPE